MFNPPLSLRLDDEIAARDATHFSIRSVGPHDEPALQRMLDHASDEDIYLRGFRRVKDFSDVMAKRLVSCHTGAEVALVALRKTVPDEILGIAHLIRTPKN